VGFGVPALHIANLKSPPKIDPIYTAGIATREASVPVKSSENPWSYQTFTTMDSQSQKTAATSTKNEKDRVMGDTMRVSQKISYSRYNSPFWQVVVVSIVAFG
jgi:hypothetical protein